MNEDRQILTKEYSLADVLGLITGRVLIDRGMDGIHSLIEWMAGGRVFAHQIPTIGPYCEKALKKQFPQLNPDENPELDGDVKRLVRALRVVQDRVAATIWNKLKAQYGDSFHVAPLQPFDEMGMPGLLDGLDASKTTIIQGQSGDEFPASLDA